MGAGKINKAALMGSSGAPHKQPRSYLPSDTDENARQVVLGFERRFARQADEEVARQMGIREYEKGVGWRAGGDAIGWAPLLHIEQYRLEYAREKDYLYALGVAVAEHHWGEGDQFYRVVPVIAEFKNTSTKLIWKSKARVSHRAAQSNLNVVLVIKLADRINVYNWDKESAVVDSGYSDTGLLLMGYHTNATPSVFGQNTKCGPLLASLQDTELHLLQKKLHNEREKAEKREVRTEKKRKRQEKQREREGRV